MFPTLSAGLLPIGITRQTERHEAAHGLRTWRQIRLLAPLLVDLCEPRGADGHFKLPVDVAQACRDRGIKLR
jgi:hypothetical protein